MKNFKINKYIDHTLLKPDATEVDIKKVCFEAVEHNFKAVCVNPRFIPMASEILKDKKPILITVVGFPLGANQSTSKSFEAKEAIANGAKEIDMVMNIGALKEKNYEYVFKDIDMVVKEVYPYLVKVIIETCFLTRDEKIIACSIIKTAKANFVKTSTGFGKKGAEVSDIHLMKEVLGKDVKIKASGGIKTYEDAVKMIEAGALRIGTSSSINIIKGIKN